MKKKATSQSLKLRFTEIPRQGLHLGFSLDDEWFVQYAPKGTHFIRDMEADIFVERSAADALLTGDIICDVELTCVRCLETFSHHVETHFSLILIPENAEYLSREMELKKEHFEADVYRRGIIDIENVCVDQIMLNLPDYPRCREDCQGLCPRCGVNLNRGPCLCPREDPGVLQRSPFRDLKL